MDVKPVVKKSAYLLLHFWCVGFHLSCSKIFVKVNIWRKALMLHVPKETLVAGVIFLLLYKECSTDWDHQIQGQQKEDL